WSPRRARRTCCGPGRTVSSTPASSTQRPRSSPSWPRRSPSPPPPPTPAPCDCCWPAPTTTPPSCTAPRRRRGRCSPPTPPTPTPGCSSGGPWSARAGTPTRAGRCGWPQPWAWTD
ncbi:MAG: hypothetical protein AVDCRST_MAG57-504, partial [uncultured Blastococcus sp.]